MTTTNERLREIRENHLHYDYPQEECQRCFLLARLDEVVKLARAYVKDKQLIDNFQHPEIEAELIACLAELEKGE